MHHPIVNQSILNTALRTALRTAREMGASDWHWSGGAHFVRIDGALIELEDPPAQTAILEVNDAVFKDRDLEWTDERGDRYRLQLSQAQGVPRLTARIIASHLPSVQQLGLPEMTSQWMQQRTGLVFIAGSTGSGKSTTMAALVLERTAKSPQHVVTLEDPVEWILRSDGSRFTQRTVGVDVADFASGVHAAMRQDPDVIVIGELRNAETARWALLAAQTGHLVIASVHASDAGQTVQRVVSLFAAQEQEQMRSVLSDVLLGVLVQELHMRPQGGRQASFEVMAGTTAVRALIREGRINQLPNVIATSGTQGMIPMAQSIRELTR